MRGSACRVYHLAYPAKVRTVPAAAAAVVVVVVVVAQIITIHY